MENASKALIIAGAILLAILLISLGIFIFSQAQDTVNNSGMSQAEVTSFNNKLLKYEGKQKGSVVRSLINEVVATNGDANNSSASRQVTVTGSASVSGTTADTSSIDNTKSYTVKITSHATDGTISGITITQP